MGDREPVVSSKRSREQVPSVFTEKLMELSRRYRFIPKDERIPFLETQFISRVNGKLPWTILKKYSVVIEDTNGSQFFGFMEEDVDAGRYLSQPNQESVLNPLLILLESFQLVLEKFTKLRDDLGEHLVEKKDKNGYPFKIAKRRNLTVPSLGGGGEIIGFGIEYLQEIEQAILEGNKKELNKLLVAIESQLFHEFLHQLSNEDGLNTNVLEEMTMLGEFLYDPKQNDERNAVFSQMSIYILNEEVTKQAGRWSERYDRAWQKVDLVILIHELFEMGEIDSSIDIIKQVIPNLAAYYAKLTAEQRMAILKKYLLLPKDDLYTTCMRLAKQHQLEFAL